MKTKEQLCEMYIEAKSKFREAKAKLNKLFKNEHALYCDVRTAQENLDYRTTQVKMLEAILEVPTEHRLLNNNPVLGQN